MTDFETQALAELRTLALGQQHLADQFAAHLEAHRVYDNAKARRHAWLQWSLGPLLAATVTVVVSRWLGR